jgi:hypothetical protein
MTGWRLTGVMPKWMADAVNLMAVNATVHGELHAARAWRLEARRTPSIRWSPSSRSAERDRPGAQHHPRLPLLAARWRVLCVPQHHGDEDVVEGDGRVPLNEPASRLSGTAFKRGDGFLRFS